jgi:hypothetical protein
MKLPKIGETWESIKLALFETAKTTKYKRSLTVPCIYVRPSGVGEEVQGVIGEDQSFLYVPLFQRVWRNLHPIHLRSGQDMYILSANNASTVNVPYLAKAANACKRDLQLKMKLTERARKMFEFQWEHRDEVVEFVSKDCPSTIDVTALDDEVAEDYTISSYKIISTKNLSFLEEVPKRQMLINMALSAMCGLIAGGFFAFIAALILIYYRH